MVVIKKLWGIEKKCTSGKKLKFLAFQWHLFCGTPCISITYFRINTFDDFFFRKLSCKNEFFYESNEKKNGFRAKNSENPYIPYKIIGKKNPYNTYILATLYTPFNFSRTLPLMLFYPRILCFDLLQYTTQTWRIR